MFESKTRKNRNGNQSGHFATDLDGLYDRFWDHGPMLQEDIVRKTVLFPALDIIEDKKNIIVEAEIPGIEAENLEVILDGKMLTIKGEKKQQKEYKDQRYCLRERSYGSFRRTVHLHADVTIAMLETAHKKGVLRVVLKKAKASEKKPLSTKKN